ncbi:hypothetical protein LTR81_027880, partial [Elasticomyces elasticus]
CRWPNLKLLPVKPVSWLPAVPSRRYSVGLTASRLMARRSTCAYRPLDQRYLLSRCRTTWLN